MSKRNQTGFSLIELLVAVSIILIITAIAIPSYFRARMAANETAAAETCRTVYTAAEIYKNAYGQYPPALTAMGPSFGQPASQDKADLLDASLAVASPTRSGYSFTFQDPAVTIGAQGQTWQLSAVPVTPNVTGSRHFFVDHTGVIKVGDDPNALPLN